MDKYQHVAKILLILYYEDFNFVWKQQQISPPDYWSDEPGP